MRRFTRLYLDLDETNRTSEKVAALEAYFRAVDPADGAWALVCLAGKRLRRAVSSTLMRDAAAAASGTPAWLVDECYESVGDLSETLALLLPDAPPDPTLTLTRVFEDILRPIGHADPPTAAAMLTRAWTRLSTHEKLVFHKLISGSFRVGVQRRLLVRALAAVAGVDEAVMAHRLTGTLIATPAGYARVMSPEAGGDDAARPYPFCLAHQLDEEPSVLGDAPSWQAEWKWDGVRAQLLRRGGNSYLWSRGEELISEQFPEITALGRELPDGTVLDGEVLAWRLGVGRAPEGPLPFNDIQKRLGRKSVQAGLFDDATMVFMAYDLLEEGGLDLRALPLAQRRTRLEALLAPRVAGNTLLRLSPIIPLDVWSDAAAARARAATARDAEGLMLKHRGSTYHVGRVRGDAAAGNPGWWKWKIDPYAVDAVLISAQLGHGRRAGLYTDYTFGVWDGDALVPFAKAYSGLTDVEILKVDAFVRRHTTERRGPVRFVAPELVFEIGFQEIHPSPRHRSGVAVRFPRMLRWRHDKTPADADTIDTLRSLLRAPR